MTRYALYMFAGPFLGTSGSIADADIPPDIVADPDIWARVLPDADANACDPDVVGADWLPILLIYSPWAPANSLAPSESVQCNCSLARVSRYNVAYLCIRTTVPSPF
jgi:hypothetical protein